MALCPQCRQALELAETIGGTLIEAEAEAEIADSELEAIFGRIERGEYSAAMPPAPEPAARGDYVLPQPLRDYAGGDVGSLRWRGLGGGVLRDYAGGDVGSLRWRGLGGGVRHLPINTGASRAKARLLYIPASSKVPDHGHRGLELTLVLAGSFYDEGAWFRRGDVEEADATVEHQPVAGPEEACICLAVTDAPLRFRSLIPRLAQPFLGI
jgi:putative transcriptional regulator